MFWFWYRNLSVSYHQIDPYFLHLAGAHFVPLACAHCYCPGGRSKVLHLLGSKYLKVTAFAMVLFGAL